MKDVSGGQHSGKKNIRFKTHLVRTDWCDYSDAYIVVKRRINVEETSPASKRNKELFFKNIAPFRPCISKINNTFIDEVEQCSVMPM